MYNSPELNGKYLGTISKDFVIIADTLQEAAYELKSRKISEYPIFPISKTDIEIGQLLIGKEDMALNWNYNFSFLQEFVDRELIASEKVVEFVQVYKDPEEFCCLFVTDADFVNFVFIPYPEID